MNSNKKKWVSPKIKVLSTDVVLSAAGGPTAYESYVANINNVFTTPGFTNLQSQISAQYSALCGGPGNNGVTSVFVATGAVACSSYTINFPGPYDGTGNFADINGSCATFNSMGTANAGGTAGGVLIACVS